MIRTRCIGVVGAMIPSRLCCLPGAPTGRRRCTCGHSSTARNPIAPITADGRICGRSSFPAPRGPAHRKEERSWRTTRSRTCWSSTDWLEEHLDDPSVRIIEVDEDTTAYDKGHIRGAVGWNWTTDLHDRGRPRLPGPGRVLARCCPRRASAPDTTVVLYGGNNNWFAAYAYWLLEAAWATTT